jgi:hypothetical protein
MADFLNNFPDKTTILEETIANGRPVPEVNGHIHTPYSFSAFSNVEQAFRMAASENIKVLGINDFNTFDGHEEFYRMGSKYKIFPLFNIEFMGLLQEEQQNNIRINDPANPGRIYFSGKGLDYPPKLSPPSAQKLTRVKEESLKQTKLMVVKSSAYMQSFDKDLSLDYEDILQKYTMGMLRERHIAKAIRIKVYEKFSSENQRRDFLTRLFGGMGVVSQISDETGIENEIRGHLLKAGGPAFVKEDPQAFLPLDEIIEIIKDAGGIPCYPVLLDDNKGNYTEYEANKETLYQKLQSRNIYSIELIPGRNDFKALRCFVEYFHRKGFIITFGTEHNTPELSPLKVSTRGSVPLDDFLNEVSFEGAAIIAAHQYLRSRGDAALANGNIIFTHQLKNEYVELGTQVIKRFIR